MKIKDAYGCQEFSCLYERCEILKQKEHANNDHHDHMQIKPGLNIFIAEPKELRRSEKCLYKKMSS